GAALPDRKRIAGDKSVGATPVPIPNTVVKPYSADGTPPVRARESRPSPAPSKKEIPRVSGGLLFWVSGIRVGGTLRRQLRTAGQLGYRAARTMCLTRPDDRRMRALTPNP